MASEVIEQLQRSDDVVERELGEALVAWQDDKAQRGLSRHLGYEPKDIREQGAIAVIEARVLKGASGFEEIDDHHSYEAIVDRHPERFRDDVVNAARRRLQFGKEGSTIITSEDIRLIASSRRQRKYSEISPDERAAYERVASALQTLGEAALSRLENKDRFELRLTSGFHVRSGVRGGIPKDLWFSVSPKENADELAGMPQLFTIVSARGIEYGFGASVSPKDFTNPQVKQLVQASAPKIFDRLPAPTSSEAQKLQTKLQQAGNWHFRSKHRLEAGQDEFDSLEQWLTYLKSDAGMTNASGTISRYLQQSDVEETDLKRDIEAMSELFEPLIDRHWLDVPSLLPRAPHISDESQKRMTEHLDKFEFAEHLTRFLQVYGSKRTGTFAVDTDLREAMSNLQSWLEGCSALSNRSNIKVKVSVGQGGWTKTPWIALLDDRETTSTQRGRYIVFLISEDLSTTYLTLNQGMTELVGRLGQRGAVEEMHRVAEAAKEALPELRDWGLIPDRNINLRSDTTAARNYQEGTIAYVELPSGNLPDDASIIRHLDALLDAYERLVETGAAYSSEIQLTTQTVLPPYGITDALEDLFLERETLERYLDIWRNKKNLILQGAPGVGKSFIARRLAYVLIGAKDDRKVQTVQFHQSYSYEDFVQGFRPNASGGFDRRDGTFLEFRDRALRDPDGVYVFVIDEINRGNLSKIFGELMLLIEPDKRGPSWKTRLAYATDDDPEFFVPENLFIIGMMNTADRSLSLVDYALRRRFAFVTMEPQFASAKFRAHLEDFGIPAELVQRVINGMQELNLAIQNDRASLGPGFRIGHSFFTPGSPVADPEQWFERVVDTEIHPLLEEYWFDAPETADQWRDQLLR